jgi:hypothetical protein
MYVAPGLLDQRLGFYTRSDDGAYGFQRPLYTKVGVYWGRIDATANQFTVAGAPQGHTDSRTTLTATVADYVPVDPFGVVKIEGTSVIYFVRSVVEVRQMRCKQLTLEEVDPTTYGLFTGSDPDSVADGVHLIEPSASAFTTGFDEGYS